MIVLSHTVHLSEIRPILFIEDNLTEVATWYYKNADHCENIFNRLVFTPYCTCIIHSPDLLSIQRFCVTIPMAVDVKGLIDNVSVPVGPHCSASLLILSGYF